MHKLFPQVFFCMPAYTPHTAHPAAVGRESGQRALLQRSGTERRAKGHGLTVAAELGSSVSGAGGASGAAGGEAGAAAPGGKDRVALPLSWDPTQSSGAPCSALDTQPCKTGGQGEHKKVLKGETSHLGRKGGRFGGLRTSTFKGSGQGGSSTQLWSTGWPVSGLFPNSTPCSSFHLPLSCSQGAPAHLLTSTGLSMPVATQEWPIPQLGP